MSKIKYFYLAALSFSIITLNAQSVRKVNSSFAIRKSNKTIHKRKTISNYDPNVFLRTHSIVPPHRTCGTMEEDSIMRAKYPQLGTFSDFQNWVNQKVIEYKKNHQDKSSTYTVYTIPIIFHIINNGESEGTGTNISQAQIQSQVTVLNEDYRRQNADTTNTPTPFKPAAADCDIEFCLAMVDTNGNTLSEPGIDRIDRNNMGWSAPPYSMGYIDSNIKPATFWDPDRYFNVWVCNLGGGLLGYTQFPNQSGLSGLSSYNGPASTDGVVITYFSVGRPPYNPFNTPYNLGRTLTHEAGHFFGLRHVWGDDNGACSGSDYCADTPNQTNMNYGSPTFPHTDACSSTYPGVMFMNYMDYVNDNTMNEFTADQKVRMMAVLSNSPRRIQLTSSNVCSATGVPGCGFTSNITTVAVGGTVQFTDISSGSPTSWSWTFPGGTPATSTAQNPTVTYNTPGTYEVILSACNANGCCHDTVLNYINVVTALGCDTLNFPPPGTLTYYTLPTPGWGFLAGWNSHGDSAKADKFTGFSPLTAVTGGLMYFVGIHDGGNGAQVALNVWDNTGSAGSPGNILASDTVSLFFLDTLFTSGQGILEFLYPNAVAVTSTYYMGFKMIGFGTGDSLGMVSNTNGDPPSNMMWGEDSSGTWKDFPTGWGGTSLDLFISPFMTDIPTQAVITASDTTICQGDSIYFNSSSSQNVDSLAWVFQNGSLPSSNDSALYITYSSAGTFYVILNTAGNCLSFSSDTMYITVLPRPNVNITNINILCNGDSTGSAIANVAGGTAPYSYFWNTSPAQTSSTAINLPAGNYTVTVTDSNGCLSTANTIITQPAALNLVGNTIGATCGNNDGKAYVAVSGGTPGYTYLWNTAPSQTTDTASNLSAGGYQVVVTDANGCKDSVNLVVGGGGSYLTLTTGHTDETCYGIGNGTAWVSVSGTTNPIGYSWSTTPVQTTDTATGLTQGTYYITVVDSITGCSNTDTVVVSGPSAAISINITSQSPACFNDSDGYIATFVSGGTPNYTYQWKNIINQPVSTNDTLFQQPPGSYKVIVTDNNGCKDSTTAMIVNPTPLFATITGTDSVKCFGESNGQAFAAASGGTGSLSFSWNTIPVQTGDTATNLPAGAYTVTVTDSNNCTDTAIAQVFQPAVLNVSIISSSNASCYGSNNGQALSQVTGGNNPYSYLWNTTPPQTGGGATNLGAGTFQVLVTDSKGCKDSTTVTITQPTQIQISFTTVTENCGTGNGSATATPSNGQGSGYSYSWSNGVNATGSSSTISNLSSGWYFVTVTDDSGCTRFDSTFVPNSSGTITSSISMTPVLCNGDSTGTATEVPGGGSGSYTYSWNTTPVQSSQTANNLPAGQYVVTIGDGSGCTLMDTVIVTQPTALSLTGSAVNAVCTNNNGKAIVSVSGGTAGYNYLWNTTPAQNTDTASNLNQGVYKVIVTDNNGCQDSVNVTVNHDVVILTSTITGFDATCNGVGNGSAVVVPTNGTAPYTYSWNSVPSQNNDTAFGLDSGAYSVTIIDSNGCVGTNGVTISQPTPIIINLIPTNPTHSDTCNGLIISSVSGGTPGSGGSGVYTYLWTPSNQTSATDTDACVGLNCLTVTDSLGCTAQACVTLTAPPPCNLVGSVITDSVSCYGDSDGKAIASIIGGYGTLTYQWNDSSHQTTDTAFGLPAGVYEVTVVDTMGCSLKIDGIVHQPQPITIYLSTINTTCLDDSVGQLFVDSVTGGTPSYSYLWTYDNATGTSIDSLATGYYTVIVTDANGCIDSSTAQVNANTYITISSNVTSAKCKLSNGQIVVTASGGTAPYSYQWNDPDSQTTATAANLIAGNYTVYVVDSNGCEDSSTITVGMNNPLKVDADITNEECKGFENGAIDVTASNGTEPYSYLWNTGADTKGISGLTNGDYTITVVDAIGCVIHETFHVGLKDNGCINVPNAFTPNADGDNDTWILRGSVSYPQIHVQIFNRWGLKIFDSIGYDVPWDGTYSGKKVSAATYYYVISLGPNLETLTGSVTIVR